LAEQTQILVLIQACASAELQVIFSKKTPCNPNDPTQQQLSDRTRVSLDEKTALSKWQTIFESNSEKFAALDRQYFSKSGDAIASLVQRATEDAKNNLSDLYNGRIS